MAPVDSIVFVPISLTLKKCYTMNFSATHRKLASFHRKFAKTWQGYWIFDAKILNKNTKTPYKQWTIIHFLRYADIWNAKPIYLIEHGFLLRQNAQKSNKNQNWLRKILDGPSEDSPTSSFWTWKQMVLSCHIWMEKNLTSLKIWIGSHCFCRNFSRTIWFQKMPNWLVYFYFTFKQFRCKLNVHCSKLSVIKVAYCTVKMRSDAYHAFITQFTALFPWMK